MKAKTLFTVPGDPGVSSTPFRIASLSASLKLTCFFRFFLAYVFVKYFENSVPKSVVSKVHISKLELELCFVELRKFTKFLW